jgi:FecR protein
MRKTFLSVALICVTFSIGLFAQTAPSSVSDMYLISSKAGKVNLVEGAVLVERNNGKNTGLNKSDELVVGEKVSTGSTGKVEILLNPGSYLRLAENSEFEFTTTGLDDLQLKLNRGSAIFEVITNSDQGFIVGIQTPQTKTFIMESGVYRIDVSADNSTKVSVWKGKAQIGEKDAQLIKGGKSATVKNSQVVVSKFDRDNKDSLDNWSKIRAKDLMAINAKLREGNLRNSLIDSFSNRGWNTYNSYGVWVYNRASGTWCFLPFGNRWRSPYGFGYNYDLWDCQMPMSIIYSPPVPTSTPTATSTTKPVDGRGKVGPPIKIEPGSNADTEPSKPRTKPVFETDNRKSDSSNSNERTETADTGNSDRPTKNDSSPAYNPPARNDPPPAYNPPAKVDTPVYNPPADTPGKPKDN